jgi:hypothetical protein
MPSKIIHLDQKDWIDLARGYNDQAPEHRKIARIVVSKADSGEAIFPLSLIHFSETVRNLNTERRKRLAKYMMLVSRGWAVLPFPMMFLPELQNAILREIGLPGYNLQGIAIKKGLSQLVGAKGTIVSKDPRKAVPPQVEKYLLERIESPETLLLLMELGLGESFIKESYSNAIATVGKLEQIRRSWQSRIRDNNLLRRAIITEYLINSIGPPLMTSLLNIHMNPKAFLRIHLTNRQSITQFFQWMPANYCYAQLTLYRDMLKARKIQPNDTHDIISLAMALPYADVVLTEGMWQTAVQQTKLDELRPTTVLRSVTELLPVLSST